MNQRTRQEFSAKGADGLVHTVDALPDALLDPSPYRTRCGQPVFEVYNIQLEVTCPTCAGDSRTAGQQH